MNIFRRLLVNWTRLTGYELTFHLSDKLDVWPYLAWDVIDRIRAAPRSLEEGRLIRHGAKFYSQNDEDGIITEIFRRVPAENRYFVEIGVGNGLENNTLHLLHQGWKGLWIESDRRSCAEIRARFRSALENGTLKLCHAFVDRDNVESLLRANDVPPRFDLLSIDIDGNDYHVFGAIRGFRPRAVVIEYNAKFPPPIKAVARYNPRFVWDKTDYFGASLKSLEVLFADRGFALVGCNLVGTNAFFVANDAAGDRFCRPFTAENHYEPPRYWLNKGLVAGHPPSFGEYDAI